MKHYDDVLLERNNPRLKDVLEKLAFDEQVWQSKDYQQWKIEIAYFLSEHFNDTDRLVREKIVARLSQETAPGIKQCALELLLRHYAHLGSPLRDNLLATFDVSHLALTEREANKLLDLAKQLPVSIRSQLNEIIMAGSIMAEPIITSVGTYIGANIAALQIDSNKSIREWWHQILRRYDCYPSYAMLLALPSDKEAFRYLKEFGKELHLITGKTCLMITLTSLGFMQYGSDDEIMPLAVEEHIAEGYCLQVAELFEVKFDKFPCLLLFRDIRKPEHILIALKGLDAEEIAQEMRILFSVVSKAVKQDKDPITAVEEYKKHQAFSEKKKATWSSVRSFAGKTFEKIMEAFVKASIK